MKFLFPFIVLSLFISCIGKAPDSSTQATPPNIVLILADDQTWMDSGAYGNPDVYTPHIDQLAKEGMRLTSAFTGTAMCSPTRQMLYTGLYPVRSGAYPNGSIVDEGTESIVHYLKNEGYRVGITGKRHVGPESSFPWELVGSEEAARRSEVDLSATVEFIQRDAEQSFFLILTSHNPHYPWTNGDASRYNPESLTVPEYLIDTPETREALAVYYAEVTALDEQIGQLMNQLEEADVVNNTLVLYSSEQGAMFPFAKWTLYDAGLKTAMIARWPGVIEAGSVSDALVHYTDVTPTFVEAAGGTPPHVDGQSFLSVLKGEQTEHHEFVFGVHTTRGINNWNDDYPIRSIRSKQYKLIYNVHAEGLFGNNVTADNRGDYYYSWKEAGGEHALDRYRLYRQRPQYELYDVLADPFEKKNLIDDSELATVKDDLVHRLDTWMQQQGDRGLATEQEAHLHLRGNPDLEKRRTRQEMDNP